MPTTRRRRRATPCTAGLVLGLGRILGASPASAGTSTNDNACFTAATATYSTVPISDDGHRQPRPVTLGSPVTLSGASVEGTFSAALFVAGYRLGILNVGDNPCRPSCTPHPRVEHHEGSNTQSIATSVTVTIIDPTPANRRSGDESAVPLTSTCPWPTRPGRRPAATSCSPRARSASTPPSAHWPSRSARACRRTGLTGCDLAGAELHRLHAEPEPDCRSRPRPSTHRRRRPCARTRTSASVPARPSRSTWLTTART